MRVSFFILSLLLTLVSCSQGKHTVAKFSLEIGNLALSSAGGLVIFGKENAGAKFTRVASGTSVTLDVPKGTWTFNAMAWDGANGPMTGVIICAQQTGVAVSGDSLSINLKLDNASCFSSAFSNESGMPDGGGNTRAFPLDPYFCETDVSGLTNTACQYDPTMPSLTPRRGFVGSYKFSIPAGASFGSVSAGETLESDCYVAGTNNSVSSGYNIGYVNIPSLASSLGLPLHIDAYLGAACEPAKGKFHLSFDNQGLAKFGPGPSMKKVYGRTPINGICPISDLMGTTDFASGNGSSAYPYVICNPKQLAYLQRNTSHYSENFILGRDINLISGIGGGSSPMDTCLSPGDTFVPIGKVYDFSCNLANSTPFSGTFDGNDFTISYFRIKDSSNQQMGFISETSGLIANIKFTKASVEGNHSTAVVAGVMNGSSALSRVKVTDSVVRGKNFTGGIAGQSQSTSANSDLFVDNVEIEGDINVGGVLGSTYSPTSRASFNGSIRTNYYGQYVGGIVGLSPSQPVSQVVSSGTIRATRWVGGIAGQSGPVQEARSDMLIVDSDTVDTSGTNIRYMGGIVGDASAGVTAGLFTGTIQSVCNTAACKIGAINGNVGSTDSYSVQYPFTLGGSDGIDTSFSAVYGDATLTIGLCTTLGGGCHWLYNAGDMPRIAGVDDTHFCVNPNENNTFANQKLADPTKGTSSNPYSICNVTQLTGLNSSAGEFYELKQNLNLIEQTWDTIGVFNGKLDGAAHVIHSHIRTPSTHVGLFTSLQGYVKNLVLAGFKYNSSSPSAQTGALAQNNQGLINNVEVRDVVINSSVNGLVGGIASMNSGTISNSWVSGSIKNASTTLGTGGIVGNNSAGTLKHNVVQAIISVPGGTVSNIGGIAGVNVSGGVITQNTFKGELQLSSASSLTAAGGIVGLQKFTSGVAYVYDNETDENSKIFINGAANFVGGIVGDSDNAGHVVKRNMTKGLFVDPSSVGAPIIDSANYTDQGDANFTFTTNTFASVPSTSISTTVFNPPNCEITVTASGTGSGDGTFLINNTAYSGPLSGGVGVFTLSVPMSSAECSSSTFTSVAAGNIQIYKAHSAPDYPNIAALKAANYDVTDMTVPSEMARALKAYFELITLGVAGNAPVWNADPGKPAELFDNH